MDSTNISKSTAHRKGQTGRIEKSEEIKKDFIKPEFVAIHWDGKILNVKGNRKSNRVCVYITGANIEKSRKLLGVPEALGGKGATEANIVKELLVSWDLNSEVTALVFDTTASNSGKHSGGIIW